MQVLNRFLDAVIMALICAYSFVSESGWGIAADIPEKMTMLLLLFGIISFFRHRYSAFKLPGWGVLFVLLSFIYVPYAFWNSWHGATYLLSFVCIYIFSKFIVTEATIRFSSIAIGFIGLTILCIYTYGTTLSGWNDNGIAITGFFCYCYYTIYLAIRKGRSLWRIVGLITIAYAVLLFSTDCRSASIFTAIMIIGVISPKSVKKIVSQRKYNLLILNIPLIVSAIIILIGNSDIVADLETWSQETLEKSAFNGRDTIWTTSFKMLSMSGYLGVGKFIVNYHNSCIAILTTFGILGYIGWIWCLQKLINTLAKYAYDKIVLGCITAFIVIYLQQSFDLGLVSEYPNLIPYMILGIAFGRVHTLCVKLN